jgi:hypothetical protein
MNFLQTAEKVGLFLLEHADLIEDVYDVIASGASKESVKAAIRSVKVTVSDAAMKEELDVPDEG